LLKNPELRRKCDERCFFLLRGIVSFPRYGLTETGTTLGCVGSGEVAAVAGVSLLVLLKILKARRFGER
jgi:hypothetical protein